MDETIQIHVENMRSKDKDLENDETLREKPWH
jgi:hypothetical protein